MHDVVQIGIQCNNQSNKGNKRKSRYDPNNRRIRELSLFARHQYPDGYGDYVLPEIPTAATAIGGGFTASTQGKGGARGGIDAGL